MWQNGREGKYGNLHYEMAAWGLGELLRSQKDYPGAAAAYELVSEAPDPDPETLQKANLAAGEMYDLLQKRELAMKKYQIGPGGKWWDSVSPKRPESTSGRPIGNEVGQWDGSGTKVRWNFRPVITYSVAGALRQNYVLQLLR